MQHIIMLHGMVIIICIALVFLAANTIVVLLSSNLNLVLSIFFRQDVKSFLAKKI